MDFSDEAKLEIEKNLGETARNISVDEKERMEIVNELRSTYYEAANSAARARGSDVVTAEDARAAKARISAPRDTADCLMKSYAANRKRAGFWVRLAAFVIDSLAIFAGALIVASPALALMLLMGMPLENGTTNSAWLDSLSLGGMIVVSIVGLVTVASLLAICFGYYVVLEGYFGYTIGKYLLGLRVLRTDGTKIGYKEAFLRNLSKYINNLIVIDAIIMLIFFYKEKQRGFDRMAGTIVVHSRARWADRSEGM